MQYSYGEEENPACHLWYLCLSEKTGVWADRELSQVSLQQGFYLIHFKAWDSKSL